MFDNNPESKVLNLKVIGKIDGNVKIAGWKDKLHFDIIFQKFGGIIYWAS